MVGTIVSGLIEAGSSEVWRLVPEVRSELRRKQEQWKYGGNIPEGVAGGGGIKTVTWELQPRLVARVEVGVLVVRSIERRSGGVLASWQWTNEFYFHSS